MSTTAHAFGRLTSETLDFAPGLNVVYGPNEAGKSTWHDALFAALCGMRRSRGSPRKEDREFTERRKPWSADDWVVSTRIALENGRRIDLHRNLDDPVDCRATDIDLGRDVSSEIMNEGSPDGAYWLGLDRRSFPATACVRQADVLSVLENPGLLQDHLQRAAASGGRDETAARAIEHIGNYRKEHIGLDRANSTRPLRRAIEQREEADRLFDDAVKRHNEFLDLCAKAEEATRAAGELDERLGQVHAEIERRETFDWLARARRARAIANQFPDGPPARLSEDENLARNVASALAAWKQRPDVPMLAGVTSHELRNELASLPAMPEGDREPAPEVMEALQKYEDCRRSVELHSSARPFKTKPPPLAGAAPEELRDLARVLKEPAPEPVDAEASSQASALREQADSLKRRAKRPTLGTIAFALLAAGAAIAALLADQVLVGASVILAGGGLLIWRIRLRVRYLATLEKLREAETVHGERDLEIRRHISRRSAAVDRARSIGAPADPAQLERFGDTIRDWQNASARLEAWSDREQPLAAALDAAESRLSAALRERGAAFNNGADLRSVFDGYRSACVERNRLGVHASRRVDLEREVRTREQAENSVAGAERSLRVAEKLVSDAAELASISGEGLDSLVRGLEAWQSERTETLRAREKSLDDFARLAELLQGLSLEELEQEAELRRQAGDHAPAATDGIREMEPTRLRDTASQLERDSRKVRECASRLGGQVQERSSSAPIVSEREEDFETANAELARVRRLDRILERTEFHLRQAQERVHRDIAPRLAATLDSWLPRITGGRYHGATLDPQTLEVKVRERQGAWRSATHLSEGTAEQIYLLLRFALAEHLTRPAETCPLLLDDVTTQCDAQRTVSFCRLLHDLSSERQIIFFTQEEEVLGWAKRELETDRDKLMFLDVGQETSAVEGPS